MNKRKPWVVCSDNPTEYVRVALAIETLAYHNKNYLDTAMCNEKRRSEEIQALLIAALEEAND